MADRKVTITFGADTKAIDAAAARIKEIEKNQVKIKCVAEIDGKTVALNLQEALAKAQSGDITQLELSLDMNALTKNLAQAKQIANQTIEEINSNLQSNTQSRVATTLRKNYIGKSSFKNNAEDAAQEAESYIKAAAEAVNKYKFDVNDLMADVNIDGVYSYTKALREYITVLNDVQSVSSKKGLNLGIDFDSELAQTETTLYALEQNASTILQNFSSKTTESLPSIIAELKKSFISLPDVLNGGTFSSQADALHGMADAAAEVKNAFQGMNSATGEGIISTEKYDELVAELEKAKKAIESLREAYDRLQLDYDDERSYSGYLSSTNWDLERTVKTQASTIGELQSKLSELQTKIEQIDSVFGTDFMKNLDLDGLNAEILNAVTSLNILAEAFTNSSIGATNAIDKELREFGTLRATIDDISQAVSQMFSGGTAKGNPFKNLSGSVKSLSEVDYSKLSSLNSIDFSGLASLNGLKISKSSITNLVNGVSELTKLDPATLDRISSIDFSGLRNISDVKGVTDSSVALSKNFISTQQKNISDALSRGRKAGVGETDLSELKSLSTILNQDFLATNIGSLTDINGEMQSFTALTGDAINKVDLLIEGIQKQVAAEKAAAESAKEIKKAETEAQKAAEKTYNDDYKSYQNALSGRNKLIDQSTKKGLDSQDVESYKQFTEQMKTLETTYAGDTKFQGLFDQAVAQDADAVNKYNQILSSGMEMISSFQDKLSAVNIDLSENSSYQNLMTNSSSLTALSTNSTFSPENLKEAISLIVQLKSNYADLQSTISNSQKIQSTYDALSKKYDSLNPNNIANPEVYAQIGEKLQEIQSISNKGVFSDGDVDRVKTLKDEISTLSKDIIEVTNRKGTLIGSITGAGTANGIDELKRLISQQVYSTGGKVEFGNIKNDYSGLEYSVVTKSGEVQQYAASIDTATGAVRTLMKSESEYVSQTQRVISSFKEKLSQLTQYLNAATVIQKATQFVREGIQAVVDIDDAMTELKKVTDETVQTYADFQKQAGEMAEQFGGTTSDVITAAGDYARLGYSLEEATELAKSSVVLKNVSEYSSITEATEALTAMKQAYQDLDAMSIVDRLNNVGNNYAISTEDLASGLQKSSSTLSLLGNSIDESAAMITAGNATLQDVNSVANGLRTISLRITGTEEAKQELEDLGEDVSDFIVQTSSKQRQTILDYTAVASNGGKGFDILDDNGNYKNTYEILSGIADIYAEIVEEDKKYGTNRATALQEVLAGKNRANVVASILSNPDLLKSVKETSENSSGSGMAENEKYLDSISGKITQLQAAFQNLWTNAIDTSIVKSFVDLGTGILNVVDNVGLLNTAMAALSGIMGAEGIGIFDLKTNERNGTIFSDLAVEQFKSMKDSLSSTSGKGILSTLLFGSDAKKSLEIPDVLNQIDATNALNALQSSGLSLNEFLSNEENVTGLAKEATAAFKELSSNGVDEANISVGTLVNTSKQLQSTAIAATKSFGAQGLLGTLKNIGTTALSFGLNALVGVGVSLALQGVVSLIDNIVNAEEHVIEKGQEAQKVLNDVQSTYDDKAKVINTSGDTYAKLRESIGSNNENLGLTTEEYSEYIDINEQLTELFPQLVTGLDAQGNSILDLGNSSAETTSKLDDLLAKEQEYVNFQATLQVQDVFEGSLTSIKQIEEELSGYQEALKNAQAATQTLDTGLDVASSINNKELVIPSRMSADAAAEVQQAYSQLFSGKVDIFDQYVGSDGQIHIPLLIDGVNVDDSTVNDLQNTVDSILGQNLNDQGELVVDYSAQVKSAEQEIKATWNNTVDSIVASMKSYDAYNELSDNLKSALNSAIMNTDPVTEWMDDEGNWNLPDNIRGYFREKLLDPMSEVFNDTSERAKRLQEAVENLFSLDTSSLTADEYTDAIHQWSLVPYEYLGTYRDFMINYGFIYTDPDGNETNDAKEALYNLQELAAASGLNANDLGLEDLTVDQLLEVQTLVEGGSSLTSALDNIRSEVESTVDELESEPITFKSLFTDESGDASDFSTAVDTYQSAVDSLNSTLETLRENEGKLDNASFVDLIQEFPELAGQTDNLSAAIQSLQIDKLQELMATLSSSAEGLSGDELAQYQEYIRALVSDLDLSKLGKDSLYKEASGILQSNNLRDYVEKTMNSLGVSSEKAYELLIKVGLTYDSEGISSGTDVLNRVQEMFNAETSNLSLKTLIGDDSAISTEISDYTDRMEKLTSAKQKLTETRGEVLSKSDLGSLLADVPELVNYMNDLEGGVDSLMDAADTQIISELTKQIELLEAAGKQADADGLRAYLASIIENANAAVEEVESAYGKIGGMSVKAEAVNAYTSALESTNEGALYDTIAEAASKAAELYESGEIGTDDFKSAASIFSASGATDVDNYLENLEKIERYITEDPRTGIVNFLDDLQSKGYATLTTTADGTEVLSTNIQDLETAARDMGMSYDWLLGMLGKTGDYGFINDYVSSTEEGVGHLTELLTEKAELSAQLEQLQSIDSPDSTTLQEIENIQSELETLDSRIETTDQALNNLFNIEGDQIAQQVETAYTELEYLGQYLSGLDTNDSLYTSKYNSIADKMREIANENNIDINLFLNENGVIEQATSTVASAQSAAQATANSNPIVIPMKTTVPDFSTASTSGTFTSETVSKITIDGDNSLANQKTEETKSAVDKTTGTITIDGNNAKAKAKASEAQRTINTTTADLQIGANTTKLTTDINNALSGTHSITLKANITGLPSVVNAPVAQTGGAVGTLWSNGNSPVVAHADGTAYNVLNLRAHASGVDVGLPSNENALVNELGTEAIVRDGKLYEIPGGTHVQALKKNDVIINARQWAEIKKYGSTSGFAGKAYAQGTLTPVMNAHANLKTTGATVGNLTQLKKNTAAVNNNTNATSNNTSTTTDNTKTTKQNTTTTKETTTALDKFKEKLNNIKDWIEVKIDRQERSIEYSQTKSENRITAKGANQDLTKAQKTTRALIKTNEAGQKKYASYANEVYNGYLKNLSSDSDKKQLKSAYKILQKGGTIDITKYSENVKEAIEAVQTWTDKSLDCKQATQELKTQLADLAKTKFDNITERFESLVDHIEHDATMINESMSLAEEKGYVDSRKYYEALISNQKKQNSKLEEERRRLTLSLQQSVNDGSVKVNDTNWQEMTSEIESVTEALQEGNSALVEYSNKIRDIKWDKFDRLQDTISRIADEQDFLLDLLEQQDMFTDEGRMTEAGLSAMGLHGSNYNVYMQQAEKYKKEMLSIQDELANDPANTTLIDRRNELLDLQQDAIKAAEDEKDAIKSLVEDGIEKELSALKDLIDEYEDALDSQKDVQDYQRSLQDSADEITSLRKKIAAYSGDDSDEAMASVQKWQKELKEAEQDLEDTQYDRYISDQKQLLSDLYDDYEAALNKRLENMDALMEDTIETINTNSNIINDTLQSTADKVGYQITDTLNGIWNGEGNGLSGILSTFNGTFTTYSTTVTSALDGIKTDVNNLYKAANENANSEIASNSSEDSAYAVTKKSSSTSSSSSGSSSTSGSISGSSSINKTKVLDILNFGSSKKSDIQKEKKKSHSALWKYIVEKYGHIPTSQSIVTLAKALGVSVKGSTATTSEKKKILKALKAKGFASGTDYVRNNGYAWTQENGAEVLVSPTGAVFQPITRGSKVLNAQATDNLYQMTNDPQTFFKEAVPSISSKSIQTGDNNFQINIDLPSVTNYDEFKTALQNDKQMIKFMQNVTIGRVNGKSSLSRLQ